MSKLTESTLRKIIREELMKEMAAASDYSSKLDAVPSGERKYVKMGKIPATAQDYDNASWSGTAGTSVFQDREGNYWKWAQVPATEEEYENAKWSGTAGTSVRRLS